MVLQFDHWRSENKELLELGLVLGSLYKKRIDTLTYLCCAL